MSSDGTVATVSGAPKLAGAEEFAHLAGDPELVMDSSLVRENQVVLDVVQAALGLISREIRAIAVRAEQDRIHLYVLVHERSTQVAEDIEDLIFELEALQEGPVAIEASVHEDESGAPWPGSRARRVYRAKED